MGSKIEDVSFISDFESKYQKGMEISYDLNGSNRTGEFNLKMGSVSILLFDVDIQSFLLVKQFRPAVFTSIVSKKKENYGKDFNDIKWSDYDTDIGYTMELCAGLIDKDGLTPEQIACEEIAEECGYKVDVTKLVPISTFVVGAHQSGNAQYMYYAEIGKDMKISEGGGNVHEGEVILKVYLSLDEARNIIYPQDGNGFADVKGPPGVLFALQWWFLKHNEKSVVSKPVVQNEPFWKPTEVKKISNIKFTTEYDKKKYGYNPKRMKFTMNDITRTWDLALTQDTSSCILIDSDTRELIFFQTLRTPVLIGRTRFLKENIGKNVDTLDFDSSDPAWAYTLELAVNRAPDFADPRKFGRIGVKQLGYDLKEDQFKLIARIIPGIGQSGDVQSIFFADVKNARRCEQDEDDDYKEVRIKFDDLPLLFNQPLIGPPNVYYAIGWIIDKYCDNKQ